MTQAHSAPALTIPRVAILPVRNRRASAIIQMTSMTSIERTLREVHDSDADHR